MFQLKTLALRLLFLFLAALTTSILGRPAENQSSTFRDEPLQLIDPIDYDRVFDNGRQYVMLDNPASSQSCNDYLATRTPPSREELERAEQPLFPLDSPCLVYQTGSSSTLRTSSASQGFLPPSKYPFLPPSTLARRSAVINISYKCTSNSKSPHHVYVYDLAQRLFQLNAEGIRCEDPRKHYPGGPWYRPCTIMDIIRGVHGTYCRENNTPEGTGHPCRIQAWTVLAIYEECPFKITGPKGQRTTRAEGWARINKPEPKGAVVVRAPGISGEQCAGCIEFYNKYI